MIRRTEGYFRGYNDFELFYQTWKTPGARGTLVITHGIGEHSECYDRLANGLLPGDYNIYAWDIRGHGQSEGKRGVIRAFSDYAEDLRCFVEQVKEAEPGHPLVLLGHSMGGLITSLALLRSGDMGAKAFVLSSPLFGIAVKLPELKEKLARIAATSVPDLTMHNELDYNDLTRDPKVVEEYSKDILRHDRASSQLYVEMMNTMEFCLNNAARITLPLLMQQAGDDRIVSRKKAEEFFAHVGSADKELKIYEDYLHEIYNDVGREVPYSDLKTWLKKWL